MEAAKRDVCTLASIVVGDAIRAIRVGDVDLDNNQVRLIVQLQRLDVLVLEADVGIGREAGGEGRQAERGKQRVFDRSPVGAGGFGERPQMAQMSQNLWSVQGLV